MDDGQRSLPEMLATMLEYREQEFARVAKLLHDQVGQVLSAVGLHLDALRLELEPQVPGIAERTAEIQNILEHAVVLVRNLSYELNPAIVERAGLSFALDRLAGRFRDCFSGTIRLLYEAGTHVPPAVGTAFYKIAELAVENAVAHAGCSLIEVLVRPTREGVVLEVRDNGTGFDVSSARAEHRGLGMTLMAHYASEAGIEYSLGSTLGKGTSVRAVFRGAPAPGP